MIVNIIDARTNKYDINCDAQIRPAWMDNSVLGATQFSVEHVHSDLKTTDVNMYFTDITVSEVIQIGANFPLLLTAYLYDRGSQRRIQPEFNPDEIVFERGVIGQINKSEKTS